MDQILIKNLTVFANHGVFEAEAVLGQKFVVSAVLDVDMRQPGRTDCLENTVHYGLVSQEIVKFMTEHRFALLEACAHQLAEHLLLTFPLIETIELEIDKPWAPVHLPLENVGVRIRRGWHTAFLALGSNMGDKDGYLNMAVEELRKIPQIQVEQVSTFISTDPYGYTQQDSFRNGACKIRTMFSPEELLDACQAIEQQANRVREIHWGPRTLDVDVLFYDQQIIGTSRLNVPHPDMANRDFVLKPMAELAPWWCHPVTHKTMAQMLRELEQTK